MEKKILVKRKKGRGRERNKKKQKKEGVYIKIHRFMTTPFQTLVLIQPWQKYYD